MFILSLTDVLGAQLFGIAANKKAVRQVDANTIYKERPGGIFSKLTTLLHYSGTVFLIAGLVFIALFAYANMEVRNVKRQDTTATQETIRTDT
jgi:hypothetical protein